MIFSCPSCAVKLNVKDDLAGRAVKCPKCQTVAAVPRVELAQTEDRIQPAPALVTPTPSSASMPPPLPAAVPGNLSRCPECRATLDDDAQECRECGWSAGRTRSRSDDEDRVQTRSRTDRFEDEAFRGGRCYVSFVRDHVDLEPEVVEHMEKLIESEQLDLRIAHRDARPPEKLGRNDLVLTGKVVHHDHGNQFIRQFFYWLALIGPGSSKLEVKAFAETDEGEKKIDAKSRMCTGFFGGTNDGLMKLNVKNVAMKVTREAARHMTGISFLNVQAYHCIYWALALGLLGFIPFAGIPFALIGLGCGTPGLIVVLQRNLPRGKVMGIVALVLCFASLLFNIIFIFMTSRR